jgi:hypothetical protein
MEYIAGQALRMNADQGRTKREGNVAQPERYRFLYSHRTYPLKPVDSEMSKLAGEIRFGDLSKLNVRQTILVSSAKLRRFDSDNARDPLTGLKPLL